MSQNGGQLSEELIQDSFHSYLKSSLTQAKAERLLDADILSSAEGDLMITGPALCLYFAALRCTTNPPSVPLPRLSKTSPPMELSFDNCPPTFVSFLHVWANRVSTIQSLAPEKQHDLARVICGLEPLSNPVDIAIQGVAADLRAVAIEISQRRSFQDRYASDLQAALDSGNETGSPRTRKASFVPPPGYSEPTSSTSTASSPAPHYPSTSLSPSSALFPKKPSVILAPESPAIEFIRETLYASIGDVLERQPSLRALLRSDPPRAYFASVAFAILDVATHSITPDGSILGVLGTPLTLKDCPVQLRPFMAELMAIGLVAKEIEADDDIVAMKCAERGQDIPPTRMDRIRIILEDGVGYERARKEDDRRRSVEGRAVAFANRVNALSLGMTKLPAFRERQGDVFKVLAGIGF